MRTIFCVVFFIFASILYTRTSSLRETKKKKKENSTKRFTLPIVSIRRFYTRTIFLIYRRWVATEPAPITAYNVHYTKL